MTKALFAFIGLIVIALAASTYADPDTTKPLIIGMELNYPPFEMTDAQGNPTGVGVDMAHALGEYLHRPIQIENTPFVGLIPALKTGRIDLIISSMTDTEERRKSIDFSDPYLSTGLAMLLPKNSTVKSISDLNKAGVTIAVKSGTTADIYATKNLTSAEVIRLDQDTAGALEVVQAKASAFLYDQMSIYQFHKLHPDDTLAILEPFQKESWAIGIQKGNDDLRKQVNAFLADFKAKKGFDALGDKYLKEDKEAFKRMGYPFYF